MNKISRYIFILLILAATGTVFVFAAENIGLIQAETFLVFAAIGFVTWYGTGLDDLLFMSIVFKGKSHDQKVIMFFGNLAAVSVIVVLAVYLSG